MRKLFVSMRLFESFWSYVLPVRFLCDGHVGCRATLSIVLVNIFSSVLSFPCCFLSPIMLFKGDSGPWRTMQTIQVGLKVKRDKKI